MPPKTEYPLKPLSDDPRTNLRPLFNSNMIKSSVIKWSQNCTIRSGVVDISIFFNAYKGGYFKKIGYAKNTTSDSPRSVLRPLYNIYFCHIAIEKCTGTIRNGF